MAGSRLTPEAVQDALKAVLARGDYPSMAKVRAELDTTASQQTLAGHMKTALKSLAAQMGTGLPEGLPRSVVDAAHRFYGEARDSAREELEAERARMTEREAKLTDQVTEAQRTATALEQQVGQLQQRAQDGESEVASLTQRVGVLQETLKESQQDGVRLADELQAMRIRAARQVRQLRATHRQQIQNLTRERDAAAAACEREAARAQDQQALWAQQIDRARQALAETKTEHGNQIKKLADAQDAVISERDHYVDAVHERERAIEKLTAECEAQRKRTTEIEASVAQRDAQMTSLAERLEAARAETSDLRERLAHAQALADERQRLLDNRPHAPDQHGAADSS